MLVELKNLRFSYGQESGTDVINIPHWCIEKGESVFLKGPSGCGKSTLLNLVSGMLVPDTGEISILEQRVDCLSARQRDRFRANNIGYVFQQFNLIPYLNSVENVQAARYFSKAGNDNEGSKPLDDVQINELLSRLDISEADRNKPSHQLSIGQQQRVSIARAIVNNPSLLIADEPTSSLDAKNRDNFMSLLKEMNEERSWTLLFVSHDESLSQHFSRLESLAEINKAGGKG